MDGVQFLVTKRKLKNLIGLQLTNIDGEKEFIPVLVKLDKQLKKKEETKRGLPMTTATLIEILMGVKEEVLEKVHWQLQA